MRSKRLLKSLGASTEEGILGIGHSRLSSEVSRRKQALKEAEVAEEEAKRI